MSKNYQVIFKKSYAYLPANVAFDYAQATGSPWAERS